MGKRATTGNVGRPPKTAKVDDESSILKQLLAGERGMSADCKDMILKSAPHALKTPPSDRHSFQLQVIDSITKLCTDRVARLQQDVDACKSEIASSDAKKSAAASTLAAAKKRADEQAAVKDSKQTIVKEATDAVTAAKNTVDAAIQKKESLNAEKEAEEKRLKDHEEELGSVWEPLKKSELPGNWHQRNKAIDRMTATLANLDSPASLNIAVTVGLKQKVDSREKFASKALEAADEVLREHTKALHSKIQALEASIAATPAEEESANAALTAAEEKFNAAQAEYVSAENEWLEQDSAAFNAKEEVSQLGFQAEDGAKSLAKAEAAMTSFLELKEKVEALREHRPLSKLEDDIQVDGADASTPLKETRPNEQSP